MATNGKLTIDALTGPEQTLDYSHTDAVSDVGRPPTLHTLEDPHAAVKMFVAKKSRLGDIPVEDIREYLLQFELTARRNE